MKTFLNPRTCVIAAVLACLSPVSWGECALSINVQRINDEKFDVTAVDKTSTDECLKTEAHKDGDEFRSHTTTIHPGSGANDKEHDTSMVINKDVWRLDEKGGKKDSYGQFGGEWPDDEHTRRLPKPDMPLAFAGVNEKNRTFTATFQPDKGNRQREVALMKAYAKKLKARGFTLKPKESEGPGAYAYRAKNGAGYLVRVTCPAMPQVPCGLELFTPDTVREREAKGTL